MDLEVQVTKSIKNIIQICEDPEGRGESTSKQDPKPSKQHPKQAKQDLKQDIENNNDYHVSFIQR